MSRSMKVEKPLKRGCQCYWCRPNKRRKLLKMERDLSTQENRDYWDFLEKVAEDVRSWPEYKLVEQRRKE